MISIDQEALHTIGGLLAGFCGVLFIPLFAIKLEFDDYGWWPVISIGFLTLIGILLTIIVW